MVVCHNLEILSLKISEDHVSDYSLPMNETLYRFDPCYQSTRMNETLIEFGPCSQLQAAKLEKKLETQKGAAK